MRVHFPVSAAHRASRRWLSREIRDNAENLTAFSARTAPCDSIAIRTVIAELRTQVMIAIRITGSRPRGWRCRCSFPFRPQVPVAAGFAERHCRTPRCRASRRQSNPPEQPARATRQSNRQSDRRSPVLQRAPETEGRSRRLSGTGGAKDAPGKFAQGSVRGFSVRRVKPSRRSGSSESAQRDRGIKEKGDAGWLRGQTTRRRYHRRSDGGPERRQRCLDGGPKHRYEWYTANPLFVSRTDNNKSGNAIASGSAAVSG